MSKGLKLCKTCGAEISANAKICPKCGAKNKKPIYKRAWLIILVLIIIIAVIAAGSSGESGDTSQGTAKVEDNAKIEYAAYTVDDLVGDLEDNAMNAEDKYADQYVEITGKLSNIDSDGGYIGLEPLSDENFTFISVQCYIKDDNQKDVIKSVSTGDTLVIKGKVTDIGEVMGYSIDIDSIAAE